MAKIRINGDTSGYIEISAPAVAGSTSITLPATTGGSLLATDASGNLNVDSGTLYVDATNNRVGIGTTSPAYVLDVEGNINANAGTLAINAKSFANITGGNTFNVGGISNSGVQTLTFYTNTSGNSATERMRIDSSGRINIGTTGVARSGQVLINSGADRAAIRIQDGSHQGSSSAFRYTALAYYASSDGYVSAGADPLAAGAYTSTNNGATASIVFTDEPGNGAYTVYQRNSSIEFWGATNGSTITPVLRAKIDPFGRMLVGTSTAPTLSDAQYGLLRIQGNTSSANGFGVFSIGRGQAPASIVSGSELGHIYFTANDGSGYASISAYSDATGGSNDYPGRLVFSTTADGASSPSERWRIDNAGSLVGVAGSAFVAPYVYNTTTATAANVNVDATGFLRRSTSSIKYKTNVETIQDQYADAILGCRPVWYQSTCEADKPEWGHWGFIAEEVAEIDPRLCFFKEEEDGSLEPEGVQYDRFVPHLLNLIKRQKEQIKSQGAAITALEARLSALEGS